MAPTDSPQNRHVPLLHFIIALLLVKSKPSCISSADFRKQLVSHIREGSRSNYSTQADAHIDMEAYWRNRSNELEEDNVTLKAKVFRLQARVSDLEKREAEWKRESTELEVSAWSQRLKRRRDGEPAKELARSSSPKRAKTQAGFYDHAVLPNLIGDEASFGCDELGHNLLDNLRNLQKTSAARMRNDFSPQDLASRLSSFTRTTIDYVRAFDLPANIQRATRTALRASSQRSKEHVFSYTRTEPEDIIEQRLIPIGRMFPHFLLHLHTLSQFSGSRNLCGGVIHDFIDVFRVLLQRISDLAVTHAKSGQDGPEITKKRNNGLEKQHGTSSFDKGPAASPIIMKLCKLVITMLLQLDPMESTHKEILEGYLYLLITRVGEVLKHFTIGDRPFGIEASDTTSIQNQHPRRGRHFKMSSAASEAEASEAQAPYLIWMLNRSQPLSSAITNSPDHRRQVNMAQPDSSPNDLYEDARIRLQHTLVRAVFGEQAAASFEPALKPPHNPSEDELMTDFDKQNETADVSDWFKNEVWRLVGWDVLRGNIALG